MERRVVVRHTGLAGGVALALVLAACGGGTGASSSSSGSGGGASSSSGSGGGGKVSSITLMAAEYSKDHTAAFWNDFAQKYQAKTGIKLNVQVVSWDDIDQQASTAIQNSNPPDILNLNAYASYAKDGLLYSSDEVLDPAVKSDVLDAFVKSGTYQGKLYGMPDLSSARALFYNKTLFQQAGISAPPKTWDEFEADAKKVSALGKGTVGYAMPLGPEEAQAEFSIWLFNNGGNWKTDGKWTINSDKNVQTLTFLKKLAVTDKVTENNPGKTNRTDGAFALFSSGKAGMVVGFSPLQGQLDKDKKVDYGIAPMPTSDGSTPQTYGVTDYLMAFKKNGNQDAVKAFYQLYYQPDEVNTFIKAEGFLPVTKSGVQTFASEASLKVYLDTLPQTHLTPTDDPAWDKVKLAVQQGIGAAVGPSGDPKKVLDGLQQQAEAGS
ncbi:carbohydrate ABC transporter substrate-binding protein (CUT1 family) [Motilibacter rhizosphaerae]|uniref:Carbohydrate ABC transporter substrate-binding protein (CUT1 family) n=1 Tax=Motilibacter rhizosphaerae TaxID=598652 RepID=A0A4Q7NU86_9ACTN|nr:extracellular solute-binding protein [Motilibacter rhizosphaerae]RZS89982.1 carbohydrate ABC transporter substrate-binding protein (CUT1 family) [Motilibacter rhizosphaerae]